ncbi:hypothetical protein T492DRAFT_1080196 [Pavlovales sp. CCMP2436]|nr:hypothetical protein T492DRAFT_1080196 [Pavlovales sp. CCMP2436]
MPSDSRDAVENPSKVSHRGWAQPEQSSLPLSPRRATAHFSPLAKAAAEHSRADYRGRARSLSHNISDDDSEDEYADTPARAETDTPPLPNAEDSDRADRSADRDIKALARQLKHYAFDFASESSSMPSGWKPTVRLIARTTAGAYPKTSLNFR